MLTVGILTLESLYFLIKYSQNSPNFETINIMDIAHLSLVLSATSLLAEQLKLMWSED